MSLVFGRINRWELRKLREHGLRVMALRDIEMAATLEQPAGSIFRERGERFVVVSTPERPFETVALVGEVVLSRGRELHRPLSLLAIRNGLSTGT